MFPYQTAQKTTTKSISGLDSKTQHKFKFDLVYGEKETNRNVYE
jgi:hypothetical protein